jgi:hypothetical protein
VSRFDVAVVGAPFLDITFEGLARLPRVGEEVVARALHLGPGGTGMQAIDPISQGHRLGLILRNVKRGSSHLALDTSQLAAQLGTQAQGRGDVRATVRSHLAVIEQRIDLQQELRSG